MDTLIKGEWSCYRYRQFNGHVMEVANLKEGENGNVTEVASVILHYRIVMLQRWSV